MPELAVVPSRTPQNPVTDESRAKSREVADSIRRVLQQATKLKDISFKAACDLAEGSSSPEEANEARARAQAIIALTKSWAEAVDIVRIARGKPLPGSLRPESKPKKSKVKPSMFTESKPE